MINHSSSGEGFFDNRIVENDSSNPNDESKLIDAIELARILSVSPWTIRKWRAEEKIPYIKIGRLVRYELRAVIASFEKGGINGS